MVLMRELKARWLQILTHVAALLPLVLLILDYWLNGLGFDPVGKITTRTGRAALTLLILSLAATPISTLLGLKQVMRTRRALGLYAFMYAGLHFLTYVGLDYGFDLDLIRQAIPDERYVLVGFAAFLLLLALAITSTRGWKRRLGKNWKRLHRLAYLAGILVIVHFAWLVKDIREPVRFGAVVALLLILRIPGVREAASSGRQWLKTRTRRGNREKSLT